MKAPRLQTAIGVSLLLSFGFATPGAHTQPDPQVAYDCSPVAFHYDDWNTSNAFV